MRLIHSMTAMSFASVVDAAGMTDVTGVKRVISVVSVVHA